MINTKRFIAKGINVSTRTIDGCSFIYLEDRKELLQLNEIGSFIWEQIDGAVTGAAIIQKCLQEYNGNELEITQSVIEFVDLLFQEKMIEISSEPFKGVMRSV